VSSSASSSDQSIMVRRHFLVESSRLSFTSCPGPGVVVILDVHIALLHVPWWWLHALRVLDSKHQRHEQVVSLHAVHLYTRKDKTN
jgi:hypothetical protein